MDLHTKCSCDASFYLIVSAVRQVLEICDLRCKYTACVLHGMYIIEKLKKISIFSPSNCKGAWQLLQACVMEDPQKMVVLQPPVMTLHLMHSIQ